jgi:sialic acid synthase SpsE
MTKSVKSVLVAEVCQNHGGSRRKLLEHVRAASDSGADFVKFQLIRARDLTWRPEFEHGGTGIERPYGDEYSRLSGLDVELSWIEEACVLAHERGIKTMVTPFTRGHAVYLRHLSIDAVKVASYDCYSSPLLEELAALGYPLYISTGGATEEEVSRAAEVAGGRLACLLHCVSIYPTPRHQWKISRIHALRKYCSIVGFSDHSSCETSPFDAALAAVDAGATVIERHFRVGRIEETKDGPVSLNPRQFKQLRALCDSRREKTVSAPDIMSAAADWVINEEEMRNREYYHGRFSTGLDGMVIDNDDDSDMARDAIKHMRTVGGWLPW